jgi:hypothetical protein
MRTQHRSETLEQAMAMLIQNQAAFVARLGDIQKQRAEAELRFARIERSLEEIKAVLLHHDKILAEHSQALREMSNVLAQMPEAVRQKIGFKTRTDLHQRKSI